MKTAPGSNHLPTLPLKTEVEIFRGVRTPPVPLTSYAPEKKDDTLMQIFPINMRWNDKTALQRNLTASRHQSLPTSVLLLSRRHGDLCLRTREGTFSAHIWSLTNFTGRKRRPGRSATSGFMHWDLNVAFQSDLSNKSQLHSCLMSSNFEHY